VLTRIAFCSISFASSYQVFWLPVSALQKVIRGSGTTMDLVYVFLGLCVIAWLLKK
jgi:hypothetical protein